MTILFGRLGNKTTDIKFFKEFLPTDNKYIIEPFGGTFAVTRLCYNDKKYKKYVNDTDKVLFNIYNNPHEYSKLSSSLNDLAKKCILKDTLKIDSKKFFSLADKYVKDNNSNLNMYEYYKKEKLIRGSMLKPIKTVDHTDFIKTMKDITFTCDNWETVVNKFKNKKEAFIFLDPPYLFSNNKQYSDQNIDGDITDIMYKIYDILKDKNTKAKIMFIINDLKILRWLFKDYIKGEYNKTYQIGKRKDNHLIICNY